MDRMRHEDKPTTGLWESGPLIRVAHSGGVGIAAFIVWGGYSLWKTIQTCKYKIISKTWYLDETIHQKLRTLWNLISQD